VGVTRDLDHKSIETGGDRDFEILILPGRFNARAG